MSTDIELARLRDELDDLTAKLQAMSHNEKSSQRRAGRNTAWVTVALATVLLLVPSSAEALPGTGSVDSGDIKNGQVKNADLANNAVTTAKINDGTVSSADIKNGTIALADLASATVQGLRPSVISQVNFDAATTSSQGHGVPVVTVNNVAAGTYLVLYTGSSRILNQTASTQQHNISCSLQSPAGSGVPSINIYRFLAINQESRDSLAFTGVTSFSTAGTVRVNCWSSSGATFPQGPEISGSTLVLVPLSKSS